VAAGVAVPLFGHRASPGHKYNQQPGTYFPTPILLGILTHDPTYPTNLLESDIAPALVDRVHLPDRYGG